MTLPDSLHETLGRELYESLRSGATVAPLTRRYPQITIDDAYRISRHMLALREARDGERVIGKKIGVTSAAVQEMLGVFQPDFGFLTDAMAYSDGAAIPVAGHLIQPRAEGEIAFRLKADLHGPGVDEAAVCAYADDDLGAAARRLDLQQFLLLLTPQAGEVFGAEFVGDHGRRRHGADEEDQARHAAPHPPAVPPLAVVQAHSLQSLALYPRPERMVDRRPCSGAVLAPPPAGRKGALW